MSYNVCMDTTKMTPTEIKEAYRQVQDRLGISKHTIALSRGKYGFYSSTKTPPWTRLAKRRAKNKRARQARKLNRP